MAQSFYILLANLVVAVHVGYVAFVVVGLAATLVGAVFRWKWIRNPWFRYLHLLAIAVVAAETVIGMTCPLTTLENYFRERGGWDPIEGDVIGNVLRGIIFLPFPDSHWIFKVLYFGFGAVILGTFLLVPPRGFPQLFRRFRFRS